MDTSERRMNEQYQSRKRKVVGSTSGWYRCTLALRYIQPVFSSVVKDKIRSLHEEIVRQFGRQMCPEATAEDIRRCEGNMARFRHTCNADHIQGNPCQMILNIIKSHTTDSDDFFRMLQGTDPQKWLETPLHFLRLFLPNYMRCELENFENCGINELLSAVKRCKPLMQMFDSEKINAMRSVRNRMMHSARLEISQQDMEDYFDVMLDFLNHITSEKNKDEVKEATDKIKTLRTDDDEFVLTLKPTAINFGLCDAEGEYLHKQEKVDNQFQIISYMASELNQLSSRVETAESINKGHEDELKAKIPTENESQSNDVVTKSGLSDVVNRADNPVPEEENISSTRHRNWYISTLALRYLKPAFLSVVQDKINSVHEEIVSKYGRLTCAKATAEDIQFKGKMVQFKHMSCPGQKYDCQTFLNIIKSRTVNSYKLFKNLQGTKPEKWLETPFDFVCLFIEPWLRWSIKDFKSFDVSALCAIASQCNPLREMFDEKQINAVKTARNKTMHSPDMEITEQDMKENVEVILDLLTHMKSLKTTDDITEAIDFINQLRSGNVNIPKHQMVELIAGCLPDSTRELLHKQDNKSNIQQRIIYMESELDGLKSEFKDAESKQKERTTAVEAKLMGEINTLKDETRKLKDDNREIKNQLEEMRENMTHITPGEDPTIDVQRPFNFSCELC